LLPAVEARMTGSKNTGWATFDPGRDVGIPKQRGVSGGGRTKLAPVPSRFRFAKRAAAQSSDIAGNQERETPPSRATFRFAKRDLTELGRRFGRILARGGLALWCWAQALLASYDPQATLVEAGARVGLASRGAAYSKYWMSRALRAAREWPQPPRTAAEWAVFTAIFHGHQPATGRPRPSVEVQIRRAFRRLCQATRAALALGSRPQDIRDAVDGVLSRTPGEVNEAGAQARALETNHA
jgi:hypothetical protein